MVLFEIPFRNHVKAPQSFSTAKTEKSFQMTDETIYKVMMIGNINMSFRGNIPASE